VRDRARKNRGFYGLAHTFPRTFLRQTSQKFLQCAAERQSLFVLLLLTHPPYIPVLVEDVSDACGFHDEPQNRPVAIAASRVR